MSNLGICAFTDEYGDASLFTEKVGVTNYFIVTAVLVDQEHLDEVRQKADLIRSEFFGTGEMKSSSIGPKDERRIRLLADIVGLNFKAYTLAVDKAELERDGGLAYHGSFFKHINRKLYDRIYRLYDNVRLTADEHGHFEYMKQFAAYIDRTLPPLLFLRRSFAFKNSTEEVMLQIADILSGTWARILDPEKLSPRAPEMVQLLRNCSIGFESWPPRYPSESAIPRTTDSARDSLIARHCMRQAYFYLREHQTPEIFDDLTIQIEVLNILLFHVQWVDSARYVSTNRLINRLQSQLGVSITKRRLRTLISRLRDSAVVIAASKQGYKIPVCERDIRSFVSHANTIVLPMIHRLKHAHDDLRAASKGEIDILDDKEFEELRKLVDATRPITT